MNYRTDTLVIDLQNDTQDDTDNGNTRMAKPASGTNENCNGSS